MMHLIHQLERRAGHQSGTGRLLTRALIFSALSLMLGAGLLIAGQAGAQDSSAQSTAAQTQHFDPVREAQVVLDEFVSGNTASIHARFNTDMASAVSPEQLAQGQKGLQGTTGALVSRGEPTADVREDGALVTIPLKYERAELNALIAFDKDHRIAGFALRPPKAPEVALPPLPADAAYTEIELRIGDEATGLPATLAIPNGKGPFSAVVLVHGSGPMDRHETIGPNRPFLDIARGLAERGIAVLRYEKRTRIHLREFMDNGASIDSETTDDAVLATALLRNQPTIDPKRVFVLGHSQGGMMAPRIAQRDPAIAGLILLAAPSRPLLDILIEQNRRLAILNDGKVSDDENLAIMRLSDAVNAIRGGKDIDMAQAPLGLPPAYWRSVEAVDPVAEAIAIKQPLLILQGARDIQVVDADWQGWKSAFFDDPRVTFKLYESLNHLAIPGEGDGNLEEYQQPGQVSPELIADVAGWVSQQTTAPKKKK